MGPSSSVEDTSFVATDRGERVSARVLRPPGAESLLVFGHGAGAGMRHRFMEAMAGVLADRRLASFRYQFPYMESGRRRPDRRETLLATVRAAVRAARQAAPDLPLLAGGKSMGGRMTSQALAEQPDRSVLGLVFFGFPLHAPKAPSTERADHLARVTVPMLFLQGTRDSLADLSLLQPICAGLGPRATVHAVDGADHSFHVLKRSGRTDAEVLEELGDTVAVWARGRLSAPA